jgi:hypothetical protein
MVEIDGIVANTGKTEIQSKNAGMRRMQKTTREL